jgi:prepilin-type N-terminal cleavage/methylation domain-containing protein
MADQPEKAMEKRMKTPCPNFRPQSRSGFTLVELLVVIAVIAILASLIFPITAAVNKNKIRSRTQSELAQLETAIESYKAKLGFYPPSDTNFLAPNVLFYELRGTTFNSANNSYETLDKAVQIGAGTISATFGPTIGGFMNCTRGGGDEGQTARNFFEGLKVGQFLAVTNPDCTVLGVAVEGPVIFQNDRGQKINPWRYNAARPIHNPSSFDLWVDVKIGNDIYRISNWGKPTIIKPPYSYWP